MPTYDFSKADVIVSVGADFLGDWQGGGHDSGYVKGRVPIKGKNGKAKMSKHFQFESVMSVTGSNADYRAMTKPSEEEAVLKYILAGLKGMKGSIPSS